MGVTPLPQPQLNINPVPTTSVPVHSTPAAPAVVAATRQVAVPAFSLMAPMVPPPLCPLPSQSNLEMPSLYGQDLFWHDITPANHAAAVTTMTNDFLISASWKVQISENNKLRIINE